MAVSIPIIAEFNGKGISRAIKEFKQLEGASAKTQYAIKKAAIPAAAALGGMFGALTAAAKGAEDARRANQKLGNVLDSMGYPKATERVSAYAESLEKSVAVDADVIKATQTKLATFSALTKSVNTAGGAFDRATMAALDMAAAGFGSAEGNAVQLGKALQDPIKGITALAKAGVTFTDQEKEKIKTLVESGKLLQAQDMILSSIEKQVGGTAAASASSFDKMKFAVAGVSDTFGEMMLPVIDALAPKLAQFSQWAQENPETMKLVAIGIAATTAAVVALNVAMSLNPFALIAAGIGLLVTGLAVAYQKFEGFRKVVNTVANFVLGYFETIANGWIMVINGIIRGYNKIPGLPKIGTLSHVTLPRVRSGGPETSGLSNSRIPALAEGGIVKSPTLALIGEAGPEAVVPLSKMGGMGGGVNITVQTGVGDPVAIGREVARVMDAYSRRAGRAA